MVKKTEPRKVQLLDFLNQFKGDHHYYDYQLQQLIPEFYSHHSCIAEGCISGDAEVRASEDAELREASPIDRDRVEVQRYNRSVSRINAMFQRFSGKTGPMRRRMYATTN